MSDLLTLAKDLRGVKTLVVGDVMLDRYWWGRAQRISPEAPVPVVHLRETTLAAGGAANVAANLAGLGAKPFLVGLIGADEAGGSLRQLLEAQGVETSQLVTAENRPTTVKTRIVAQGQHVVRLDWEETAPLADLQAQEIAAQITRLLPAIDSVVISDYAKGLLTPTLLAEIIGAAQRAGRPVLVDPKGRDYRRYAGATLLTPNRAEAAQACGLDANDAQTVAQAGAQLLAGIDIGALLITQGENGMTLFRREQEPEHFPARARKVFDVTGAGDTVIATLALALGAGASLSRAAQMANIAGGLVVEQVGTTVLTNENLQRYLAEDEAHHARGLAQSGQ
jgi:D-beta-D-heptose 7-phosphate kinase/D-beta-D-heptose 1-phosphate adenosyltransferase